MTREEREKQAREVLKFLNGGNVPVVVQTMNKTYAVLSSSRAAVSWWCNDAENGTICSMRVPVGMGKWKWQKILDRCLKIAQDHDIMTGRLENCKVVMRRGTSLEQILIEMDMDLGLEHVSGQMPPDAQMGMR